MEIQSFINNPYPAHDKDMEEQTMDAEGEEEVDEEEVSFPSLGSSNMPGRVRL